MFDHVAKLARLEFSEDERAEIKADLQKMISFVERLQKVDTTGIQPLTHMGSTMNAIREDAVKNMISKADALQNAPVKDEHFIKVPKVINPQ